MILSGHECSSHLLLAASLGAYLMALLGCVSPVSAGELRLGTAAVKITPPLGTPMAGYYSARARRGSSTTSMPKRSCSTMERRKPPW